MGQAVGQRLAETGHRILVALDGRSTRTRGLAEAAGFDDVGTLDALVARVDVVLTIIDPGQAIPVADTLLTAMKRTGRYPLFADCNALAPATKVAIADKVHAAGGHFVDGGIIGPPPRGAGKIRLYVSGAGAASLSSLATPEISVRIVSDRAGDAAAVKMCYGGVTKGLVALAAELLVAAERLGVASELAEELKLSQPVVTDWMYGTLLPMPPKAYRWVPETLEIAATFEAAGLSPRMMQGAADVYGAIARTDLGRESPEVARTASRRGPDVVDALARQMIQEKE
jgi:3-hydroxyisobutyrate dehydrogenase-like beta-hydroxyacid dehydrogenase